MRPFSMFFYFGIIKYMPDHTDLEQHLHDLIVEICMVLYRYNYQTVSMGGLMRVLGVGDDTACQHDQQFFELDDDFKKLMMQKISDQSIKNFTIIDDSVPPDATLH